MSSKGTMVVLVLALLGLGWDKTEGERASCIFPACATCRQKMRSNCVLRLRGGMANWWEIEQLAVRTNLTDHEDEHKWFKALEQNETNTSWFYRYFDNVRGESVGSGS
eukprot:754041-Hanusia_phi.AAC.6